MVRPAYSTPLPLPAGALRRRLEVFSPKLARRVSLGSYAAWRCWVALEANPGVMSFCERPAHVAGRNSGLIDFWVQLQGSPGAEFWMLWSPSSDARGSGAGGDSAAVDDIASVTATTLEPPKRLHDYPVRPITPELLSTWEVPVANWAQIIPVLVSFRGYRQPLLEQSVVVLLVRYMPLAAILAHFPEQDPDEVAAALYWLLATGRVLSPDLTTAPLSNASCFRRT